MHVFSQYLRTNLEGKQTPLFIEGDHVQTDFIFIFLGSLTGKSHTPRISSIVPMTKCHAVSRLLIRLLPLEY